MSRRARIFLAGLLLLAAACGGTTSRGESAPDSSRAAATTSTSASGPAPFTLPDASSFTESDVVVGQPPSDLGATLRMPAEASSDQPVPAVVIVHGFGPNDRDGTRLGLKPYRDVAESLADRGIATLTYDKRTNAHPESFLAGDYTVQDEVVDDAVAAVDLLRTTEGVDADRVFVVGHGLGGMLAPRIAAQADGVAGLVLLAPPARPLEQVTVDQFTYLAELDGSVTPEEQQQLDEVGAQAQTIATGEIASDVPADQLLGFPSAYWNDLRGYDPVAAAGELSIPVLVLWGTRSYEVTEADFAVWRQAASADDSIEARDYEGLNFYFVAGDEPPSPEEYAKVATVAPQVVDDIAAFIDG